MVRSCSDTGRVQEQARNVDRTREQLRRDPGGHHGERHIGGDELACSIDGVEILLLDSDGRIHADYQFVES